MRDFRNSLLFMNTCWEQPWSLSLQSFLFRITLWQRSIYNKIYYEDSYQNFKFITPFGLIQFLLVKFIEKKVNPNVKHY